MTIQEIAIFKRFMARHELRKNFIKKYHSSIGLTRNPESIEEYFSNVKPERVITSAIRQFVPNEAMGFDFWVSVDDTWKEYLEKMRSSHTIEHEEASTMRGYYTSLRENWDTVKPWVFEPVAVAQLRYGLITEEDELEKETLSPETPEEKDEDPLADFDFFDTADAQKGCKLKAGKVSLNISKKNSKITFNREDSDTILNRGLLYVRLAQKKTGEICLVLNGHDGVRMSQSTYRQDRRANMTVNSKMLVTKLSTLLNINQDYSILNIEQLTTTPVHIIYKVSKQ